MKSDAILVLIIFWLLLFWLSNIECCSPRNGYYRRRKTSALIFKQHLPNVPEQDESASGRMIGQIRNEDEKRFKKELIFVENSKEIGFENEEETNEDHWMTPVSSDF